MLPVLLLVRVSVCACVCSAALPVPRLALILPFASEVIARSHIEVIKAKDRTWRRVDLLDLWQYVTCAPQQTADRQRHVRLVIDTLRTAASECMQSICVCCPYHATSKWPSVHLYRVLSITYS